MRDHQSPRARPHWNPGRGTYPPANGDALRLCEGRWRHLLPARRPAAPAEFLVVNLIPEHNVELHEHFASNGDDGFGAAAAPKQGAVVTFEVDFRVGGDQASLAQDESEQPGGSPRPLQTWHVVSPSTRGGVSSGTFDSPTPGLRQI